MEYRARIRNITLEEWVHSEENGKVVHTKDESSALVFYDEADAESTLEYLNDELPDSFVLIVG